jgi:carboxymethylenebutenolidase
MGEGPAQGRIRHGEDNPMTAWKDAFILCTLLAGLLIGGLPVAFAGTPLPPDADGAAAALAASPRHTEYVELEAPGLDQKIHAFVAYPERSDPAPVVIVIHEIYGLTDWIKGVADQLAAEGFIAVAPDFISGKAPGGGNTDSLASPTAAVPLVSGLTADEIEGTLRAAAQYGANLDAGNGHVGAVGFCWGGRTVFGFAVQIPAVRAGVVYYGNSPSADRIALVGAPVLGLYGENDARVNVTIEPGREAMEAEGKSFEAHIYDGAGHGFLRQQDGHDGANLEASRAAWPRTLEFLRDHLEIDDESQP